MRKSLFHTCRTLLLTVAVGVSAFSAAAVAADLPEYRGNIRHLSDDLDSIIDPSEDSTAAENRRFEAEVLREFPELLPAKDRIEWRDSVYEINNQWVYDALRRFEKEPLESPARRRVLIEIRERLDALDGQLGALENQAANQTAKDTDKQKLAEILRRPEYFKAAEKQESLIESLIERFFDWLAEMFPRPNIAPDAGGGFRTISFLLQMLLYAAILGVTGYVVYRFAPFFFDRFRAGQKRAPKERVVLGERLAADETARHLFEEAENLARGGDLRAAIRKGYIALLCELSERKVIGLSVHKTNRDYLRDVRRRDDLYENMRGLTVNYERCWYGSERAREKDWEDFKNGYRKAVSGN